MTFLVNSIFMVLYAIAFHFIALIVEGGIDVLVPNGHPFHHGNIMHGLKSKTPKVKAHYDPYGNDPASNFVNSFFNYPAFTGNQNYYNYVSGGSSQWDGGQPSATYGTEEVPQSPPPSNEPNPIYIAYYAPHENRRLAHFGVVIHFKSTDKYAEYHFGEDGAQARYYQSNGRLESIGRSTTLTEHEVDTKIYDKIKGKWQQSDYNKYNNNCFTFVKKFLKKLTGNSYSQSDYSANIWAWVNKLETTLRAIREDERSNRRRG